jgi:hypothetical protein
MITPDQLRKICSENKYIILRHYTGGKIAINCKVAFCKANKWGDGKQSPWVSWKPCNLNEYITFKTPFKITPK